MLFREKNDRAVLESIMAVMNHPGAKTEVEEGVGHDVAKKLANRNYVLDKSTGAQAKADGQTGMDTNLKTSKSDALKAAKGMSKTAAQSLKARLSSKVQQEEVEQIEEARVGANHLHVSDAGNGKYKVHAVGKNFAQGIEVGDHLSDTDLDDFSEMGGKVKHVEAPKPAKMSESVKLNGARVGANHLHVSDAGNGKYKVHAVGKNFAHGIEVGEHLSDTDLDDFSEMGGKVKHVEAPKPAKMSEQKTLLGIVLESTRRVKLAEKASEDDEDEEDNSSDNDTAADQNIVVHLKKSTDTDGQHDVKFSDGSSHKVPAHVAHSVLGAMLRLKPADRAKVQDHIQQSHKNLMDVHKMLG